MRVTTVSPGPIRTAIWEGPNGPGAKLAAAAGVRQADFLARLPATMGMVTGRLAEPSEVADLIAYLLSPRAASITGSNHRIDGGAIRTA